MKAIKITGAVILIVVGGYMYIFMGIFLGIIAVAIGGALISSVFFKKKKQKTN